MTTIRLNFFGTRHCMITAAKFKKIVHCVCLVVLTGLAHAQEVKMYTGCNMVLAGNVYVVVNNTSFKNNGLFTAGSSTVVFSGNTDTGIAFLSGTSNTTFNNLTLNKSAYGIALKSWAGVKNVLTISAGKFYSNGNLTLLSDSVNTARLAAVPTGAYIYGNTRVERYIPSKRAWRLMTGPVTSAATIYNSWQNAGVYAVGKGLLISGPGAANGLDNGNAYSLKKWNLSGQAFLPVTNTNVSISPTSNGSADNTGYFVFIRGDRNTLNFTPPNSNNTTLTSIGSLQTGVQTFSAASVANAYTLIGNPYASPIDFNAITTNNLLKRFYVWDPSINSLGAYVIMDDVDNDGVYSKSVSASAQTKEIQSSQAFFVQTSANGAASLSINESAKSSTNNSDVFKAAGTNLLPGSTGSLRANLYILNEDNSLLLADGSLAEFQTGFTDDVTNEDAIKFSNTNESIGFIRHTSTLGIERRPLITRDDTLFIKLWKTAQRNYQLQLTPQNIDRPGLTAYLEDSYLGTRSPISLSAIAAINFSVDANAGSSAADRFRIVFRQPSVLVPGAIEITAHPLNKNIQVEWQVKHETNIKYEVEKSADGSAFNMVNASAANTAHDYSWIDEQPFAGKNYYRIKSTGSDGVTEYSPVVSVLTEMIPNHFTVKPNPVKGSSIHIQFASALKGNCRVSLINSTGQVIVASQLFAGRNSLSQVLKIGSALPAGLYQLQITGPSNTIETQKVVIER